MQYYSFLMKCTKGNKMKKVALKIDSMHFFDQLPKFIIISSLIDIFMLILQLTDKIYFYFRPLPMTDSQYTLFFLQVISKTYAIFVGDWWNRQWFCGGSIKSKHNTLFPKWAIFLGGGINHANRWLFYNKLVKLLILF